MWLWPQVGFYIFTANLWLLSYPHTVATYQRSYFRSKTNKFKVVLAFAFFILLNFWVYKVYDLAMLMNIYFYSQFFHYFRQNFGLAKIYSKAWNKIDSVLFHLINATALLVLWINTSSFFGYKLYGLELFTKQHYIYFILLIAYGLRIIHRLKSETPYSPMLLIHLTLITVTVSSTQFFLIGWLGLHFFHNIQYLLMNWQLNKRTSFVWSYTKSVLTVVILYSTVKYFDKNLYMLLPLSFIVILSVNYSHYYFDSYLWKRKYREAYP